MKYTWEPDDIVMGRRVTSHNKAENYLIGYDVPKLGEKSLYLISGRDGMLIGPFKTAIQVAHHLNVSKIRPLAVDPNERNPLNP